MIGNVLPATFKEYEVSTPLNLFKLPAPEFEGDRRMFKFMHESWNLANNGGGLEVFVQTNRGRFVQEDSKKWGLPETRWALALGTGDFNRDGFTDLYVANDFGPDDLYFNRGGKRFENIKGKIFGSIGRDTYKGMNASVGDVDRNGWLDVYVSNVHHDMQAEGSLLWMFSPPSQDASNPTIEDRATQLGALNERRFGWGATMVDFDNDAWLDIAQANGMVDNSQDRVETYGEDCPDYWYTNEKLARSPPWIHSYADRWGDLRGYCIHSPEWDRLYLNLGPKAKPQFLDIAQDVGIQGPGNSRGMAAVDLNNDGRMDLVTSHVFKGPTFYKNTWFGSESSAQHWIGFKLKGNARSCNLNGLGSTLTILSHQDGLPLIREAQAVDGFNAQNDRRIHFGLGKNAERISVEVNWCQGEKTVYRDLAPDQYHVLSQ